NYYGDNLPSVSFYKAVGTESEPALPTGYFSNKVVFVGAKLLTKFSGERKDEYPTPFSNKNFKFVSGVEIQATGFLNLVREEWLNRLPPITELVTIALTGIFFGIGLVLCRPVVAPVMAILSVAGIMYGSYLLFRDHRYWFPWMIVVVAQIPIALL